MSGHGAIMDSLREVGYRLTPQRMLIVSLIHDSKGHITAEELHSRVVQQYPFVDISTVYRKLLLEDGRIVGAVVIGRAEHVQDLGVVQAMIRRRTDVSRWRHMLHGERINYGMLAFESAKR